jgi:putative inorganic carbon (hco3(-)) transporter
LPAAMILYGILKFNRTILVIAVSAGVAFLVLINISTSNNTLYRFQSAFKPDKDLSYIVRKNNQKRIQPFIQSHPLGGGLGSTGEWGERFSPNSYLAHFPPDSGYVRVAVECGWLGMLIFCTLMFTILRVGINNYYAIKDPELKSYALSMLLITCAFNIGNFPQEALVQYPSNVFFYLVAALIVILKRMDDQKNALVHAAGQ